jgi:PTH1 family peptidyl-tRNA hydrolase
MLLFVGLGNPNPNNENNRHNVGFKTIDSLNKHFRLSKQKPKFKGLLTTGKIEQEKVFAIKPLTFMNNSGVCIRELIEYFKIDTQNVFVFHDDMDIELGKIRAKFGGSSAGHNGIESLDKHIGNQYSRIRIGISHPNKKINVDNHVLQDFNKEEEEIVKKIIDSIITSVSILLTKKFDIFSNRVNENNIR